jgi:hypothetical protein
MCDALQTQKERIYQIVIKRYVHDRGIIMKRFIVWSGLLCVAHNYAGQHQGVQAVPCNEYPRGACVHCQAHRARELILTKKINCYVNVLNLVKSLEESALRHENSGDAPESTESHCMLCELYALNVPQDVTQRLKLALDELNHSADDSSSSSSSSSGSTVVYYSSSSSSASTLPSAIASSETVAGLLSHDDLRNGTSHGPLVND